MIIKRYKNPTDTLHQQSDHEEHSREHLLVQLHVCVMNVIISHGDIVDLIKLD